MNGVISGGWEFVIATYVITALAFTGYAATIFIRLRGEARRAERQLAAKERP